MLNLLCRDSRDRQIQAHHLNPHHKSQKRRPNDPIVDVAVQSKRKVPRMVKHGASVTIPAAHNADMAYGRPCATVRRPWL